MQHDGMPQWVSMIGTKTTIEFTATLAQLVEQRFCKPQVVGSSPTGGFGEVKWTEDMQQEKVTTTEK